MKPITLSKYVKCSICGQFLLSIAMIVICIIASIQFAISVEISDICNDTPHTIMQAVNVTVEPSNDVRNIIEYYVYCDEDKLYAINMLYDLTDTAIGHLNDSSDGLSSAIFITNVLAQESNSFVIDARVCFYYYKL